MKVFFNFLLLGLVVGGLGLTHTAFASTYYVSTLGSDAAQGTLATPFKTLQHAADITLPGDTVYVRGGTYTFTTSQDPLTISRSGNPQSYITYQNYPGETPVIQFTQSWEGINVLANYIVIDGFTVIGEAQSLVAKGYAGTNAPSTSSGVGNSACINVGWYDAAGPYYTHVIVRNNNVSYCSQSGIQVLHADYVTVEHNIAHDNSWWSSYAGSGISMYESYNADASPGYKNSIVGNTVYKNINYVGNKNNNYALTDGEGIIIDDNSWTQNRGSSYTGRTLVSNNTAYDNGGPGIEAFSSAHVDITNNTVYQNFKNHGSSEIAVNMSQDVVLSGNSTSSPAVQPAPAPLPTPTPIPTPAPLPPPPAPPIVITPQPLQWVIGARVQTNARVHVRSKPSTSKTSRILCTQPVNTGGVIVDGPQKASGYVWFKINYSSGCNGWSAQSYLDLI